MYLLYKHIKNLKCGFLLLGFLVHLSYSLPASANPKNFNKLQQCGKAFSSKSNHKIKLLLEELLSGMTLEKTKKKLQELSSQDHSNLLEKLFSHENKEQKISSTKRIMQAIADINPKSLEVQQILAKELSSEILFEWETEAKQIKKEIIFVLEKMQPKDPETLHHLVEALKVLHEEWALKIRYKIYAILLEAVSEPTVRLKEKTKQRLAGRIPRKIVPSEEKLKIIEILSETKSQNSLTLQWLAEGLNDSDSDVRLKTVKALRKILQQKWYSFLIVYLRGWIPSGFNLGDQIWVKNHIARTLENNINQNPHPHPDIQGEAIKNFESNKRMVSIC